MPLDPQAAALLAQMQEAGVPPLETMTIPEARLAGLAHIGLQYHGSAG